MSSITDDLHAMREHYDQPPLRRADLNASPFIQFSKWLEDAVKAKNQKVVSTCLVVGVVELGVGFGVGGRVRGWG